EADDDDEIGARAALRDRDGLLELLHGLVAGLVARQLNHGVEGVARQDRLVGARDGDEVVELGAVVRCRRAAAGDELDLEIDGDRILVVDAAAGEIGDLRLEYHICRVLAGAGESRQAAGVLADDGARTGRRHLRLGAEVDGPQGFAGTEEERRGEKRKPQSGRELHGRDWGGLYGLVRAVAHRLRLCRFAATKPYLSCRSRGVFQRREAE